MNILTFGILSSGKLGALCTEQLINYQLIKFVFTDRLSKEIIDICTIHSIPIFIGNPRNGKASSFVKQFDIDVLLSINYLFIVEQDILKIPKKYAINFHGSLLPKYRGRTPHIWAIINNEKETGVTSHIISEKCDEGDIVYQEKIIIPDNATGASLLNEFNHRYPLIISKVISMIENNSIKFIKQDSSKATYFEKRTPDDGEINWNWQKERIYNWVRAQSRPYPGAFTFYNNNKIVIHNIKFSDFGFHQNDVNGKILDNSDLIIVKTPNGAISLTEIESDCNIKFIIGEEFHERR